MSEHLEVLVPALHAARHFPGVQSQKPVRLRVLDFYPIPAMI